jgi:hypothetical protein
MQNGKQRAIGTPKSSMIRRAEPSPTCLGSHGEEEAQCNGLRGVTLLEQAMPTMKTFRSKNVSN